MKTEEISVFIRGDIGGKRGVSSVRICQQLERSPNAKLIRLEINSGGGDVFEALAIYSALVMHPARVVATVVGVAASAATLILQAADERRIAENAQFMVHEVSGATQGREREIKDYLQLIKNANNEAFRIYADRTGMTVAKIRELLSFDNWMTARKAVELGFADTLIPNKRVQPASPRRRVAAQAWTPKGAEGHSICMSIINTVRTLGASPMRAEGFIDAKFADKIVDLCSQPNPHIILCSGGGLVKEAQRAAAAIAKSGATVEVDGMAYSAAVLLLAASPRAIARRGSSIMTHCVKNKSNEDYSTRLKSRGNLEMGLAIGKKMGVDPAEVVVRMLTDNDLFIDSEEAVRIGLIDELSDKPISSSGREERFPLAPQKTQSIGSREVSQFGRFDPYIAIADDMQSHDQHDWLSRDFEGMF